jgi:hypothetical protein
MITQFPYVSLDNFRWVLLSRDRLLLLLFHAAILFGPFQCETIVCTAAQSFQYKYGALKTLPSKKEDDVTCETTAQRMMRFNNGDRSENRERICPKDVEYLVQTIVDDVATSICPLEDNSLNLTIYASLPSYSPNLGMYVQIVECYIFYHCSSGSSSVRVTDFLIFDNFAEIVCSYEETSFLYSALIQSMKFLFFLLAHKPKIHYSNCIFMDCYWGTT